MKLVICDMDGTVIGRDERIPKDARDFIEKLGQRGIMFTVATGRSEGYMRDRIERMGITCPYIATNGATILHGDKVLRRVQFSIEPLRGVLNEARKLGMSVLYTFCGRERTEYITDWIIREGEKRGFAYQEEPFTEEEWKNLKADKLLIMDPARQGAIDEIERMLQAVQSDALYVRYRNKALELNEKSANKAAAVTRLAELLGIALDEILVIGDDDNDIEMFQMGCKSAAVSNVSENARPFASYVSHLPEFQGVKEIVRKFCFDDGVDFYE